ncbi:MAG: hypothetical protein GF421_04650 [Candidatus Aminicenantes bacterium]|nr:hypothetical protein [Candidatus Aminicenantes bacterium]
MNKYIFWNLVHKHTCIALNEDLSKYAQGETFWKALFNLGETTNKFVPSVNPDLTPLNKRIQMYYETGLNKVEILVEQKKKQFSIQCSNSRSFLNDQDEQKALLKYIRSRAEKSIIDPGLKKL